MGAGGCPLGLGSRQGRAGDEELVAVRGYGKATAARVAAGPRRDQELRPSEHRPPAGEIDGDGVDTSVERQIIEFAYAARAELGGDFIGAAPRAVFEKPAG